MGIFEKENEQLLSYDSHAFLYFALTVLSVILLPWTYWLIKAILFPRPSAELDFESGGSAPDGSQVRLCKTSFMEARRRNSLAIAKATRFRGVNLLQIVALTFGWLLMVRVLFELKDAPTELRTFDPYDILGVARGAELKEIKKAYRVKSLQHHPDKDKDNPLAPVLFQQVSKAYQALTEETARKNYEKYGNPDGPVQMKMGIALHPALLVKENQIFTLCCFFAVLFIIPFSVVCCCLRGSNVSSHGVSAETLKIFNACINLEVTAEDTVGLLAASAEERRQLCMDARRTFEAMALSHPEPMEPNSVVRFVEDTKSGEQKGRKGLLKKISADGQCEVEVWPPNGPPQKAEDVQTKIFPRSVLAPAEPRIPCPFSDPLIRRCSALLWAHLRRLHAHMAPSVQAELTNRLVHASKLGRAMISIASHGEGDRSGYLEVVRNCIMLQRCLVQAMDFNDSPLLQLPHVRSVPKGAPSFSEVLKSPEQSLLKRLGNFTEQQVLDIQSFCQHLPMVELSYSVEVNDEEEMAEGDMATLKVTFTRTNLSESESAGPVHAPFFPVVKHEEWWLLVYDKRGRRMIAADLVLGTGRVCKSSVNFIVPRPGDFEWSVIAMCDSYAGLDVTLDVHFKGKKKSEVDRSIFIHPEDAEIRSFFEELMMGLDQDHESDSEDEEDDSARQQQMLKRDAKKAAGVAEVAAVEAQAEGAEGAEEEVTADNGSGAKEDAGSDEDEEEKQVPEGSFFRIMDTTGCFLHREPTEETATRVGSVPKGTVLRGFLEGRPEGWLEVPTNGAQGIWVKVNGSAQTDEKSTKQGLPAEDLGDFFEMRMRDLVKGHAPVCLLKRWIRRTTKDVTAEDLLQVREMDNARARFLIEDLLFRRLGGDGFSKLLDEAEVITKKFQARIKKARGFFQTSNGIIWYVNPEGEVKGLTSDGNKIRDRIQVTDDDALQIGPFRLDEDRPCSCIHWIRKDDPEKTWNWSRDNTLRSRVRLGTGERA